MTSPMSEMKDLIDPNNVKDCFSKKIQIFQKLKIQKKLMTDSLNYSETIPIVIKA